MARNPVTYDHFSNLGEFREYFELDQFAQDGGEVPGRSPFAARAALLSLPAIPVPAAGADAVTGEGPTVGRNVGAGPVAALFGQARDGGSVFDTAAAWLPLAGTPIAERATEPMSEIAAMALPAAAPQATVRVAAADFAMGPAFAHAVSPPAGAGPEIVFISGVNYNEVVAPVSYNTWNADLPATYNAAQSTAFKWGNSKIGTPGGNVTYWFDGPSNWTATEQSGFTAGLALWSAEANITFSLASSAASASVIFLRGNGGTAFTSATVTPGVIGSSTDGVPNTPVTITIDTSVIGFGPIGGAFDRAGNYPWDTLVHEEGHMLGLGHGGAYNAGDGLGSVPGRQFSVYDTRLWSIMSYIEPADATATFFSSYPVTGTNWASVRDPVDGKNYVNDPTTPMILDILAMQLIYGAPVSGPLLGGGHTFGFNSNLVGPIKPFFDFTVNTHPIVTIWDGGTGNTLDLSGWSAAATINLNPGTFSSANGDVNNIAIAMGTTIETAIGGSGSDAITGNGAANNLRGGGGNDTLVGGSNFIADADTLRGGLGADRLDGQGGIDTADYSDSTSGVIVNMVTGTGSGGTAAGDTLFNIEIVSGSPYGDNLTGDYRTNALYGVGGNDTLVGGGSGYLYGGVGDDTYIVGDTLNSAYELADQGYDTVRASVRWVLEANIEDLFLTGTGNINGFGNALANHLTGNSGNNYLQGFAGPDSLAGGAGNDYYELGDLSRPGQFSLLQYDSVTEGPNAGIDTVSVTAIANPDRVSTSSYTLGANVENGIIVGTVEFNLSGNELANTLTGNAAFNVLTGRAGDDTYFLTSLSRPQSGSAVLDVYDTVVEAADGGIDTVVVTSIDNPGRVSTSSYTLGDNVENGTIIGTLEFNLRGNALANRLAGNTAYNVLTGGVGDDTYLLTDLARPQSNAFTISVYDTVVEEAGGGIDTILVTAVDNPDTFSSTERYTLGANIENGTIVGTLPFDLTGNEIANTLRGNSAANKLIGLSGDDRYYVADGFDSVIESAGQGSDRVFAATSYTLGIGQEVETLTTDNNAGLAAINLTGNELANLIYGNAGNNTLDGKGGGDWLVGFGGTDRYIVDNLADRITETAGGGTDQVLASVSYNLTAGAEVEILSTASDAGTGSINLRGNALGNIIFGNAGINIISGREGNDILFGLGGKDYFLFETAPGPGSADQIRDFSAVDDTMWLSRSVFPGMPAGALAASSFKIGGGASDADDYVIYENLSGRLFFDSDGAGGAAQLLFATLTTLPAISAADFVFV